MFKNRRDKWGNGTDIEHSKRKMLYVTIACANLHNYWANDNVQH